MAYFNPRSHEGSDTTGKDIQIDGQISIHAPTRGATEDELNFEFDMEISIHAPTRGATVKTQQVIHHTENFNPRSHEGSDGVPRISRFFS